MTRHAGPKSGTYARRLLEALGATPHGALPVAQAIQVMPSEYRSIKRFESLALNSLADTWAMATYDGHLVRLLPAGDAFLQQCRAESGPAPERYVGQIAAPRTVPPFKRLDMAKLMRGGPSRPGMDDLRGCPSLMGNKLVAPAGGRE